MVKNKRVRGTTYLLAGIDPRLWKAAKAKAAKEGHTIRWVILQLLTRYVAKGL